jgi:hypothetical protein
MSVRYCSKCKIVKEIEEFAFKRAGSGQSDANRQQTCRVCRKLASRTRRLSSRSGEKPTFPDTMVCDFCHDEKPFADFPWVRRSRANKYPTCRECRRSAEFLISVEIEKRPLCACHKSAMRHIFNGDELECARNECDKTWYTQQQTPDVCMGYGGRDGRPRY